jgi:hypothetical protein
LGVKQGGRLLGFKVLVFNGLFKIVKKRSTLSKGKSGTGNGREIIPIGIVFTAKMLSVNTSGKVWIFVKGYGGNF